MTKFLKECYMKNFKETYVEASDSLELAVYTIGRKEGEAATVMMQP